MDTEVPITENAVGTMIIPTTPFGLLVNDINAFFELAERIRARAATWVANEPDTEKARNFLINHEWNIKGSRLPEDCLPDEGLLSRATAVIGKAQEAEATELVTTATNGGTTQGKTPPRRR